MNKKILVNLFTIVPFALWGYIALGLSRIKNVLFSEQRLNIYIISIFIYLILVFYYILLILYLKRSLINNVNSLQMCHVCLAIGCVFLICSFLF